MTSTPESWDDVGTLRLQLESVSFKIEDFDIERRRHHSQLQQLKDEVALIQTRERCLVKVGITITAVFCACVLALLALTTSHQIFMNQMQSDDALKTHLDRLKASEAGAVVPASWGSRDIQRNLGDDQQEPVKTSVNKHAAEGKEGKELSSAKQHSRNRMNKGAGETMKRAKRWGEAQKAVKKTEPEPMQTPPLEVQSTHHAQSSSDSEGRAQSVATSIEEDPRDARKDAKEAKDKNSKEAQDNENGDHPTKDPSSWAVVRNQVKRQFSYGVFWVCFPSSTRQQNKKQYAPVFIEVARRQNWMVYPFCHLDVSQEWEDEGEIVEYAEHLCEYDTRITFVLQMEKSSSTHRGEIPTFAQFDECYKAMLKSEAYVNMQHPAWFRRTFPPDQDIQASLVEEFLNDVYSGNVPEVAPSKSDL